MTDWFTQGVRSAAAWSPSDVPKPVSGNSVEAFITPLDFFVSLGATIRACTGDGDFIYLSGWELDLSTLMDPVGASSRATLLDLLTAASKQKVQVRVLLDSTLNRGANKNVADAIAKMGGGGIIDWFHQPTGSQHQKLAIVRAGGNLTAYCGGGDIANHRSGRDGFVGPPPSSATLEEKSQEWHDVQVAVRGPAAVDIWNSYSQRWHSTADAGAGPSLTSLLIQVLTVHGAPTITSPTQADGTSAPTPGNLDAQVVRTYPSIASNHFNTKVLGALISPLAFGYPFANSGEHGILDLIVNAISKTESTIYLEDQYLVDSVAAGSLPAVTESLRKTIEKPGFGLMVIAIAGTGTVQGELHQGASRRKEFIEQLGPAAQKKVVTYQYKGDLNSPYWFHSKTWIFDDAFAVISSANVCRRSFTNDAELGVGVFQPTQDGTSNFAKDLRVKLWLRHLNARPFGASGPPTPPLATAADVDDFVAAAKLWNSAPLLYQVDLTADKTADIPLTNADAYINQFIPIELFKMVPALSRLRSMAASKNRDIEWSLIDPDGS